MKKKWWFGLALMLVVCAFVMLPFSVRAEGEGKKKPAETVLGAPSGEQIPEISINVPTEITLSEEDENYYWVGTFTAPADGEYVFFSEWGSEVRGYLYSDENLSALLSSDEFGSNGKAFCFYYSMKAGEVVYLKVSESSEVTCTVTVQLVNKYDLTHGSIKLSDSAHLYDISTGISDVPVTVKDFTGKELSKGTDYELVYMDEQKNELKTFPSVAGYYYFVYAKGKGAYKGKTDTRVFQVYDGKDLSKGFIFKSGDYSVTEPPIQVQASVYDHDHHKLTEGTDYQLYYFKSEDHDKMDRQEFTTAPSEIGDYYMYAEGIAPYHGKTEPILFSIYDPYDIGNSVLKRDYSWRTIFNIPEDTVEIKDFYLYYYDVFTEHRDYLYEGTEFEFDHYVNVNTHEVLTELPNQKGTYYAVYKGISPYKGEYNFKFEIRGSRYDFTEASISINVTDYDYTGETIEPRISVLDVNGEDVDSRFYQRVYYSENGDLMEGPPKEVGIYKLAVRPNGDDYTGETPTVTFRIIDYIDKAIVTLGSNSFTYDKTEKNPGVKSVVLDGKTLVEGSDYTVKKPVGRKNAGIYIYTITGKGAYKGTVMASFTINPAASSITIKPQAKNFTGKALAYSGTVTKSGSSGKVTYTYYSDAKGTKTVKPANVKKAGIYYVKANVAADGNYKAASSKLVKFTINKVKNPLKITKKNKTLKATVLKKGSKKVQCFTAKNGKGKLTYKLVSVKKGKKSAKKNITFNAKTGKITVKKGTAKGTYTVKIKITAKGDTNYKPITKSVTLKIKVN